MKKLKKLLMLFHCMLITIVHAERLTLTPELTNSSFRLHWQNNAVLQTSPDLLQWHDLRISAPYTPALDEMSAFYRLRLPDYLLINNLEDSTDAALLDWQGNPVHTWNSTYSFGGGIYLLDDLTLLKPGRIQNTNPFAGGGIGGNLRLLDWDSNVLWDYNYYSSSNHCAHHDIEPLPNGNLLLIAWEYMDNEQAIALGRNPEQLRNGLWPDTIVELKPLGTNDAEVVWKWRAIDHLVQDHDPTLPNYGVISDHPHRININYPSDSSSADWLHCNSIDYHSGLDQILISCPTFNEIWIIDHSTTTAEAAGPAGDLLYRWGNPAAYGRGTTEDQQLGYQHDAHWIPERLPGAGNILLFNNGRHRNPAYSSADEIIPPLQLDQTYTQPTDGSFGPTAPHWSFGEPDTTNTFFSPIVSSTQRLPTGNTLILAGSQRLFIEVTPDHKTSRRFNISGASGFIFRTKNYYLDL